MEEQACKHLSHKKIMGFLQNKPEQTESGAAVPGNQSVSRLSLFS